MYNKNSLDTIAASLAYAIKVESPMKSAPANEELVKYIDKAFGEEGADRVFMYNPDADAEWIDRKYT